MPGERAQASLHDVVSSADYVLDTISRLGLTAALADRQTRSSLLWELFVIGEATVRLRRETPDVASRLTAVEGVVAFRNFLAHGYDRVEAAKLEPIVALALPRLHAEAVALLAELEAARAKPG